MSAIMLPCTGDVCSMPSLPHLMRLLFLKIDYKGLSAKIDGEQISSCNIYNYKLHEYLTKE